MLVAELVALMNRRLDVITTSQGIGVSLRWRRRDDLAPDVRLPEEEDALRNALTVRLDEARHDDPEAPHRDLIARVLDYRSWHNLRVVLHRPGRPDERLTRRSALSEGEKTIVTYLPLFAAVAASCDSLAESAVLAITEVLRDADLGVIVLGHSHWDGTCRSTRG